MGSIQMGESGNIIKEKSGWPATLSFSAKRCGSKWCNMLKVMSVFSNLAASLVLSCIKVAKRHSPTHSLRENSTLHLLVQGVGV